MSKTKRHSKTEEEMSFKPRPKKKRKRPGRKKHNEKDILELMSEQGLG